MNSVIREATARQIVHRAMTIIKHSVNVMDEHGIIIASGDPHRLRQRHEGAVLALTENRIIEIDAASARQLRGVRPGINLPVVFDNRVVGVVGISGEPEQVRAYAELVRMAAEMILEQAALLEQNQWENRYRQEIAARLIAPTRDSAALASMAAWLDLDLSRPRVAVILQLTDSKHQHQRQLLTSLENSQPDILVTLYGINQLVLLVPLGNISPAKDPYHTVRRWLRQLPTLIDRQKVARVLVGGIFSGDDGLYRSWSSAQAIQAAAPRLRLNDWVVYYHQHLLTALFNDFAGSWQAQELCAS